MHRAVRVDGLECRIRQKVVGRPSRGVAQTISAGVDQDAIEPMLEERRVTQGRSLAPRRDEGVVSRVLARIEACEVGDFGFHKWFSKTPLDVLPLGIAPISACVLGSPHVRTIAA